MATSTSSSKGSSTSSSSKAPAVSYQSKAPAVSYQSKVPAPAVKTTSNVSTSPTSSGGKGVGIKVATNPTTGTANPVTGSSPIRADNSSLERGINNLRSSYNSEMALMQEQQQALADRRTQTVNDIKSEFDITSKAQQLGQASDYAARSTNLITSGGGFLGATQSQEGVLQNLRATHEAEKTALFTKREAAINAANIAYEDKDFALAREMSKNATDLQKEIYKRQTDFADQELKIAASNRAQTELDINIKNQWNSLSVKYPSAGILESDSLEQVNTKIRDSNEYKLDIRKAEADIANTRSLINERNSNLSTKPFTVDEILQYQTDYPDAGIVMGDSPASIKDKINPPTLTWDMVYADAKKKGATDEQARKSANEIFSQSSDSSKSKTSNSQIKKDMTTTLTQFPSYLENLFK